METTSVTGRERVRASSGFKFEPRQLAANPKSFGRMSGRLVPADGVDDADPRFRGAQLQHAVSNAIREELLAHGYGLADYLEQLRPAAPGMSYDRVIRIQRGETLMQLADLTMWCERFERVRSVAMAELASQANQ